MKRLIFLTFLALVLYGCEKEEEKKPAEVSGWKTFEDGETKFEIKFPKNWVVIKDDQFDRFLAYSSKKARQQALFETMSGELADEKDPAAKIQVWWKILDSVNNYDYYFNMKTWDAGVYTKPEKVKYGSTEWVMQNFKFDVGFESVWEGSMWYAVNPDTLGGVLTIVEFNVLAGAYSHYKPFFDDILKSIKLAQRPEDKMQTDTIIEQQVADPPSKSFKTITEAEFSIQIPKNFDKERLSYSPKGVLQYWNFMGKRRGDSNILVDKLDAKNKSDLKKIVEELQKKVRGASAVKQVSLGGGQKGYVYAYVPRKNIKSQAYYSMKGNKLYRVTINWYTGKNKVTEEEEEQFYKETFIKSAKSITLK